MASNALTHMNHISYYYTQERNFVSIIITKMQNERLFNRGNHDETQVINKKSSTCRVVETSSPQTNTPKLRSQCTKIAIFHITLRQGE